ncbi:syntaxin-71-like [Raphanus sativus]|uniref:Syntaxin-71-like n=1 Tax=Raphanus sativus TaxID=3726 RepID=A0A9W3DFX4_RAPSA|nr:syntaxin-71-like [Raphanus sativus]XP_056852569.1 syntaxin-71-like [Raphanus sativus]XP_056862699.1 syntaxin-71-like [Raphanus sativus]XP_056862700.1 syntaxin-71-like [Raphanus sativus]XP_056865720.1 syntaxin-71-like [Raphanus sativus]XP_056865721.1 syntaxin-71-like [Raphanus sativus]
MKHYDVDKQRESNISGDDSFARLYGAFETQIETALEKAEIVTKEKNRASAIEMKPEIRRTKARLSEEVPKLQRLAIKRLKGLTTEELAARKDLVLALPARIESIPDGTAGGPKSTTSYFCIN